MIDASISKHPKLRLVATVQTQTHGENLIEPPEEVDPLNPTGATWKQFLAWFHRAYDAHRVIGTYLDRNEARVVMTPDDRVLLWSKAMEALSIKEHVV